MSYMEYERVWAEVDLDSIAHNIIQIRKSVSAGSRIMSVVKADGYGHGAVETSKVLIQNGADALGVSIFEEGVQLRENNINVPILIFGYTPETKLRDVINNNLIQTVYSRDMAHSLSDAAVRLGKTARVHIKIDTGMSRLGFLPGKQSIKDIIDIYNMPNINITGVYTHFASSDTIDKSFTYEQYEKYYHVITELESAGIKGFIRHASNSGAVLGCRDLDLDMVRSGILMYGLPPSAEVGIGELSLLPAMSLKSHVCHIKTIEKDTSVSYCRTFFAERDTVVATVSVGYADGYPRSMTKGGRVLVGGEYAPVIGNVCMDFFMVDVTDIKNVKTGDEVVLIGEQGGKRITAEETAGIQGTINFEVVCAIGKRVPRVYIKDNALLKKVNFFE